ncbi:MAG: phosphate propanoyltransferase [Peptostreptococcaceae bacterium]|nr:phosphate propanoyltransferase [Peptostreptococcaceae bacterium]
MKVNVGLSNRHIHVSQEHLDLLFGKDYKLTEMKPLSQPGQYAAEELVDIVGPKGTLRKVRILGPVRGKTQLEVSAGDARSLGVSAPVRDSGDLAGSPGCKIVGPNGEVDISEGVIIAARHIHMTPADAERFDVKDKDLVSVETEGQRGLVFKNVLIRVSPSYFLEMHLDIEEGNAAGLKNGDSVEVINVK